MTGRCFFAAVCVVTLGFAWAAGTAHATSGEAHECFSKDIGRRVAGCSKLLAQPDIDTATRAQAYSMRALALSLMGRYSDAIKDYDRALNIRPNFPVALNNRAWAKFRSGQYASAWPDVNRSLRLDPFSPHAHDTRAHLHHVEGRAKAAYDDYRKAMQFGGAQMIKLYQCGLQAQGHYLGPLNGIVSDQLMSGLKTCTEDKSCDPLPPDEECKVAMS